MYIQSATEAIFEKTAATMATENTVSVCIYIYTHMWSCDLYLCGRVTCMPGNMTCMPGHVTCMPSHMTCMPGHKAYIDGHMTCIHSHVLYVWSHDLYVWSCYLSHSPL